jgi:nucleotide-binding universal stress UspA family protein
MFQHILVPLDGSPRAEQALPVAARIARSTGSSLLLVQVVSLATDYSGGWAPAPMENQEEIDQEIGSATTYLKSLATSPELAGIEIKMKVLCRRGNWKPTERRGSSPCQNLSGSDRSWRTDYSGEQ